MNGSSKPTVCYARNGRRKCNNVARQIDGEVGGRFKLRDSVSADGSRLRVDDIVIENNFGDGRHVAPRKSG